jgi:hypothetical protein
MNQNGFWSEQERVSRLINKKPVLTCLSESIQWKASRSLLDKDCSQECKSNAGSLQLFNLSDDEVEFQVNDINHYGYKNSICIDAEHGFIRRFVVTSANIHDRYDP